MGTSGFEDIPCDLEDLGAGRRDKLWVECEDRGKQRFPESSHAAKKRRMALGCTEQQLWPGLGARPQTGDPLGTDPVLQHRT